MLAESKWRSTPINFQMEDNLIFSQLKDRVRFLKREDYLNIFIMNNNINSFLNDLMFYSNGRQHKFFQIEDNVSCISFLGRNTFIVRLSDFSSQPRLT